MAGPGAGERWSQGTDLEYLRALAGYWADGFDWRARERDLNAFAQFRAEVDGATVHFVHQRARSGRGVPLVLSHGWPSAFTEYLELVPYLTDPVGHGIDGPAFDVVIPSLPGYGFSPRPARAGVTYRHVAGLWHRLMHGLGYHRYGAHGADFGAGVTTYMALDDPGPLLGSGPLGAGSAAHEKVMCGRFMYREQVSASCRFALASCYGEGAPHVIAGAVGRTEMSSSALPR